MQIRDGEFACLHLKVLSSMMTDNIYDNKMEDEPWLGSLSKSPWGPPNMLEPTSLLLLNRTKPTYHTKTYKS